MGGLKLGEEAQAKFDEARKNPDLAGMLDKKGAKRKNWNTRWFVLKDNYLFYCKNQKTNPQGIINLHDCTVRTIEGPTARPHSFSLLAHKSVSIDAKWTNRTYYLAAKDQKDMQNWMKILEDAGKRSVEKSKGHISKNIEKVEKKEVNKPKEEIKKDSEEDSEEPESSDEEKIKTKNKENTKEKDKKEEKKKDSESEEENESESSEEDSKKKEGNSN